MNELVMLKCYELRIMIILIVYVGVFWGINNGFYVFLKIVKFYINVR